jgi:phosphatidylglycerol---prolipoprotein diacylglyceryl transferase
MGLFVIPYPEIDPVAVQIGPFPVRWYALAYIGALGLGWIYARLLVSHDRLWGDTLRPSAKSISDLVLYVAIGVVFGGRLGDVLFYEPSYFIQHPLEIAQLWNGGMAFMAG